jgi:hypothetical protein
VRPPQERRSIGLETHFLHRLFGWILTDSSLETLERPQEHSALLANFWAYEAKRLVDNIDEDNECPVPDTFGYNVVSAMAHSAANTSPEDAAQMWRPVFAIGPRAHYAIGIYLNRWFYQLRKGADGTAFCTTWRQMLEFALAAGWTQGRGWNRGAMLLRQLLGFGETGSIGQLPDPALAIRGLRDLYQRWVNDCLTDEEDNVAGFAHFLANDVGAPLRLDNLQPIAQALSSDRLASPWRRDRANDALVELADVTLAKNAPGLLQNTAARDGLVAIIADLTARQVPGALTLQERVTQLR